MLTSPKYVQKAGDRSRYRRKVPQGLSAALRKGEIITPSGRSDGEEHAHSSATSSV
jgi:hypothetical protein